VPKRWCHKAEAAELGLDRSWTSPRPSRAFLPVDPPSLLLALFRSYPLLLALCHLDSVHAPPFRYLDDDDRL
jgi:hypothetical protein